MTSALQESVFQLLDGSANRRVAVTLKDGAGRFVGELVSIDNGTLTVAIEIYGEFRELLRRTVDEILSVELL
jgi:hypothetical protein